MNLIYLVLAVISLPAVGQSSAERKHLCSYNAESAYSLYESTIDVLTSSREDGVTIIQNQRNEEKSQEPLVYGFTANLDDLSKAHQEHFASISNLASVDTTLPPKINESQFLQRLDGFLRKAEAIDKRSYELDSAFMNLTDHFYGAILSSNISEIATKLKVLKNSSCSDFELVAPISSALEGLQNWSYELGKVKGFIADYQQKRYNLLNYIKRSRQYQMRRDYSREVHAPIVRGLNLIIVGFAVADYASHANSWWFRYRSGDNYLASRYMNIHESIRFLYQRLQEAEELREGFLKYKVGPADDIVDKQIKIIDWRISMIARTLGSRKALKWEDLFKRMISNAKRRYDNIEIYPKNCKATIQNLLSLESELKNKEDYKLAEARYKRLMDTCAVRETLESSSAYDVKVEAIKLAYQDVESRAPSHNEIEEALVDLENMSLETFKKSLAKLEGSI